MTTTDATLPIPTAPDDTDDRAATLEVLFLANAAGLRGRLLALTRDPSIADDLVSEAFLRLALELHAGRAPNDARAWLYRVGANLVVSRARRASVATRALPGLGGHGSGPGITACDPDGSLPGGGIPAAGTRRAGWVDHCRRGFRCDRTPVSGGLRQVPDRRRDPSATRIPARCPGGAGGRAVDGAPAPSRAAPGRNRSARPAGSPRASDRRRRWPALDRATGRDRPRSDGPRARGPAADRRGMSNQAIADVLFISRKTASVHASNIFDKRGAANRAEAAAIAHRLGLAGDVPPPPRAQG